VVCAGLANAGSITAPATPTKYAIEALAATTAVTLPNVVYSMGVGIPQGTNFTIIFTPPATGAFSGTCPTLVYSGLVANATTAVKRQSASECAYTVSAVPGGAGVAVADTFTFASGIVTTHGLNVAGASFAITVNLWDSGETARIDNSGPKTSTIATGVQSINIYAATSDTRTVADVNAIGGPLTGFLAVATAPAITIIRTAANLTFDNNSIGAVKPDGATPFDFKATTGTATVVLSGTSTGAATNGFWLDLNGNGTSDAGERFALTPTSATLAGIASTVFPAEGTTATITAYFQADGITQLGTSRTFAVTGTITPQLAGASANGLLDPNTDNAKFWVWSANASQLMTPYFTTNSSFLSRYYLLNTGSASVSYSTKCYAESGVTITPGTAATGTLIGNGLTTVNAPDVCSFGATTRGSVVFTINAPINTVKGSYQYINPTTLNGIVTPLTRPYNQNNPTE
jgi:hypothetical protein